MRLHRRKTSICGVRWNIRVEIIRAQERHRAHTVSIYTRGFNSLRAVGRSLSLRLHTRLFSMDNINIESFLQRVHRFLLHRDCVAAAASFAPLSALVVYKVQVTHLKGHLFQYWKPCFGSQSIFNHIVLHAAEWDDGHKRSCAASAPVRQLQPRVYRDTLRQERGKIPHTVLERCRGNLICKF